jgi:hypothetical protein
MRTNEKEILLSHISVIKEKLENAVDNLHLYPNYVQLEMEYTAVDVKKEFDMLEFDEEIWEILCEGRIKWPGQNWKMVFASWMFLDGFFDDVDDPTPFRKESLPSHQEDINLEVIDGHIPMTPALFFSVGLAACYGNPLIILALENLYYKIFPDCFMNYPEENVWELIDMIEDICFQVIGNPTMSKEMQCIAHFCLYERGTNYAIDLDEYFDINVYLTNGVYPLCKELNDPKFAKLELYAKFDQLRYMDIETLKECEEIGNEGLGDAFKRCAELSSNIDEKMNYYQKAVKSKYPFRGCQALFYYEELRKPLSAFKELVNEKVKSRSWQSEDPDLRSAESTLNTLRNLSVTVGDDTIFSKLLLYCARHLIHEKYDEYDIYWAIQDGRAELAISLFEQSCSSYYLLANYEMAKLYKLIDRILPDENYKACIEYDMDEYTLMSTFNSIHDHSEGIDGCLDEIGKQIRYAYNFVPGELKKPDGITWNNRPYMRSTVFLKKWADL